MMTNKRIFLTGGAGFLGKHIQRAFSNRYDINAPIRNELDYSDTPAVDHYFKNMGQIDCILNAANIGGTRNSTKSEHDCLYENIKVFRNIFQNRNYTKKFIQFGSGAEYSKPFYKENILEEDAGRCLPVDAYGMSKLFSGQLLENLDEHNQFINLRIFGIFGPCEDYRIRFISNAIVRSLFELPIILNQNSLFDYVYLNDFLKILEHFIQDPAQHVSYNITTGTPITLIELANIIKEITNNKHDVVVKNKSIKETYTGSNQRLKAFLPKSFTFTPIETSIKELYEWYKSKVTSLDKASIIT